MANGRVFVGGLTYKIRERDIDESFRRYGRIRDIAMKNGYAFVEFDDRRDADDAVHGLNGRDINGERITVERARGAPRAGGGGFRPAAPRDKYGPPTRTKYRLVVENLSSRCSWQDLKDHMRKAGDVTYADAHRQQPNEGVVEFATYADMRSAMERLDDTEINGRRIRLVEDRPARGRSGDSRSRSPASRSRSRDNGAGRSRLSRSRSRDDGAGRSRSRS